MKTDTLMLPADAPDYIDHPAFAKISTERRLFGAAAASVDVQPGGLSREQETLLFMRLNHARRKTALAMQNGAERRRILFWWQRALDARSLLARLNMPLVIAMTRHIRVKNFDFNEMVSEGNMALLRSIEKFDFDRGHKFSTYACRAILKAFSRATSKSSRRRRLFPMSFVPEMESGNDRQDDARKATNEDCLASLRTIMRENAADLNEVEQRVIAERFSAQPKTLEQVGAIIGVTKERIRQIQNKALLKLRGQKGLILE